MWTPWKEKEATGTVWVTAPSLATLTSYFPTERECDVNYRQRSHDHPRPSSHLLPHGLICPTSNSSLSFFLSHSFEHILSLTSEVLILLGSSQSFHDWTRQTSNLVPNATSMSKLTSYWSIQLSLVTIFSYISFLLVYCNVTSKPADSSTVLKSLCKIYIYVFTYNVLIL